MISPTIPQPFTRWHVQVGLSQAFRKGPILRAHRLHEGRTFGGVQDVLQQQHWGVLEIQGKIDGKSMENMEHVQDLRNFDWLNMYNMLKGVTTIPAAQWDFTSSSQGLHGPHEPIEAPLSPHPPPGKVF